MRGSQPASAGHCPDVWHISRACLPVAAQSRGTSVCLVQQGVTCWSMEAAAQVGARRWHMALHKLAAISCISHDWSTWHNGLRSLKFLCCAWQQILVQGSSRSLAACKKTFWGQVVCCSHGRQVCSQPGCVCQGARVSCVLPSLCCQECASLSRRRHSVRPE